MPNREPTAEQFLSDVAHHSMTIALDQGIYRRVRIRNPMSSNQWFDIVTWPSCLTIHGDMGCWTFSRVDDMFTFFRRDKLEINASYWSEKISNGVNGGRESARHFDEDAFRDQLIERLTNSGIFEGEALSAALEALKEDLSYCSGQYELLEAASNFKHEEFSFELGELPDGKVYAYHFIWCLYAIVWTIQQWDAKQFSPLPDDNALEVK